MLEHKAWNLALACEGCNGKKSDAIPGKQSIERLLRRNELIQSLGIEPLPQCVGADFKEWTDRDLGAHIVKLRATAIDEGFPEWRTEPQ